eukprot:3318681-Alexandrium_andersonii.AAC.1
MDPALVDAGSDGALPGEPRGLGSESGRPLKGADHPSRAPRGFGPFEDRKERRARWLKAKT